ncbi:probable cytochrome P450 6a14 [Thrips palmi]|uniref:Probable cytochrome P450 6a14 n=1 Tax=Thrips palmi TaxID=161013 RepID=A0A6P8ZZA0_THRPL|nr:probable cytochrome P450 6a14 [Thrips palmi]
MLLTASLAVAAALAALICVFFSWHFDYWTKRGIPSVNALSLTGDRGGGLPFNKCFWTILDPVYNKYKKEHRFVGTFQGRRPVLVVLDPEMVKMVLTKEFSSFHDRGNPIDEVNDPMSINLFNLEGSRWKNLRSKLSPTFTSGKLKIMFPLMAALAEDLNAEVTALAAKGDEGQVEVRDVLVRFATDVIGTVAFGIDCNTIKGGNRDFQAMTREFFDRNVLFLIRLFLVSVHPLLVKLLPFKMLFAKCTNFFLDLMRDTVEYREQNNIERNDFVNLMMQLREQDRTETDRVNHVEFNGDLMASQAFLFFIAGLDSVASTVGFSLHELAMNPELQQRAAAEVRTVVAKHGGLTYEALRDMDLVERVIREALRKWGPAGILMREPTAPFKLPGTDAVVDKTCLVWIPVHQLSHDPEFFPEPERFDPDRFTEEARAQRHPYAYLPFGEGPRFCIAERFAVLEMKLALAALLAKKRFVVGEKTAVRIECDKRFFSPTPKGGFWLRVEDRDEDD